MKKLTENEISEKIFSSTNSEYTTDGILDENKKCLITHTKCGYTWKAIPKSIWRGISHCPKCSRNILTNDHINNILDSLSLDLESELPENIQQRDKIKVKCRKCGKVYDVIISNLISRYKKGYKIDCYSCRAKELRENKNINLKNNNFFNVKSVSDNSAVCICKTCGKESVKSIYNVNKYGCKYCAGNVQKTTEEIKNKISEITNNEYELLNEYENSHSDLIIMHKKCGKAFITNSINFISGNHRCPYCCASLFQKEIYDFIKNIFPDAINNDRKILKDINKELDIYIPSKKVAIECNGLYWHREDIVSKNDALIKLNTCTQKGIRLITIFEDEFEESKELVLEKISHILGCNSSEKLYARKCVVKEVPAGEKNMFLNKYHIQGTCCSSINLGLYYLDELVAVMTFAKPRCGIGQNKNRKNKIELTRFATTNKYRVIGGFSKLISYFIKKYVCDEIYSYGDLRWLDINNNVYIKNGFILDHVNEPNYWYFFGKKRYHRFGFRKDAIKNKFPEIYDKNLTEFEMMDHTKYKRIWDCGTAVFSLSLS